MPTLGLRAVSIQLALALPSRPHNGISKVMLAACMQTLMRDPKYRWEPYEPVTQ